MNNETIEEMEVNLETDENKNDIDLPVQPDIESETKETEIEDNLDQTASESEVSDDQTEEQSEEPIDFKTSDPTFPEDFEPTMETVIEAILFATDEPLTVNRIEKILETGSAKQIRDCIKNLNSHYEEQNRSFRIENIAGGYQMMTLSPYNHWLKKMLRVRTDNKLTQAALETLAIIAYKQPIIRADVEAIRGVASGEMIRSLMYKGLVKIVGRAEILGRPILYGTTKKFLDIFGLASIKDLPNVEELKKPDNES